MVRKKGKPDIKAPITARGDELAKQLNPDNNEILNQHPQARERVRHLVNAYESVFTNKDIAGPRSGASSPP